MQLREFVIAAFDAAVDDGTVARIVKERMDKTIAEIVGDALGRYSPFAKQVEKAVQSALTIDPEQIDLPSYNELILKILTAQVASHTERALSRQVVEQVKNVLAEPPESITLSTLVEQFIAYVRSREEDGCVCHGPRRIGLRVRTNDSHFSYVELNESDDRQRRVNADITLGVYRDGKIFSLRFDTDPPIEKQLFGALAYGPFQQSLIQMRAAGTKLVFDADPDEIETGWNLD